MSFRRTTHHDTSHTACAGGTGRLGRSGASDPADTLPFCWGATAAERALTYPCDGYLPAPQHCFFRGVDVAAPAATMYRWLQQLRIAPYSHDWADNFLLPSPGRLTPRASRIAVGQRMMHVLSIVAFEPDRTLTLGPRSRAATALLGRLYGTYVVTPRGADACRLFVKVNAVYPRSLYGRLVGGFMPWIDLFMMRKQLMRLKAHAERSAALRGAGDTQNRARV